MATRLVTATFVVEADTDADAEKVADMVCDDLRDQPDLWISGIIDWQNESEVDKSDGPPLGNVKITRGELKFE